jgi:hypothetical protein
MCLDSNSYRRADCRIPAWSAAIPLSSAPRRPPGQPQRRQLIGIISTVAARTSNDRRPQEYEHYDCIFIEQSTVFAYLSTNLVTVPPAS